MSKGTAVESIPLCCNASVKVGEHFIKNKIFSYSMDETCKDVLKDLLEDWKYKAFKCKKKKKKKKKNPYLPTHLLIVWVGNAKQTIF
jgi:hypothetical protein